MEGHREGEVILKEDYIKKKRAYKRKIIKKVRSYKG